MKELLKIKFYIFILRLLSSQTLFAQTITGQILDNQDSSFVMFVNIVVLDSTNKILQGTTSNQKGEFKLKVPKTASTIKIFQIPEYVENRIVNFELQKNDSFYLGNIYLVKPPILLQTQFKGISKRKEHRNQQQIIKDYNNKVNSYQDIIIQGPIGKYTMTKKTEQEKRSERLKLIYIIDFRELIKK